MLLRLVLNRPVAIGVGAALCVPAVWLIIGEYPWETGLTDGLAMLTLATGLALLWTGVSGRQPDWMDPDG